LSIVLVTHTLRQARRIADYVVFMYMGEMVESGPAGQVFSHPVHDLTREFVGGSIG
ncbi:MAG: phosphate ABC transporter ATP-binding protein, partial [Bacteroidetes bacterium HGW-Bacteroidetes-22]